MADAANRSRGSGRRVRGAFAPKHDAGTATRHYRAFWQRRCRAAAAGAVLKPLGGNCAVLPLHRKTEYDSRCLFMPPFGAWERVKGKRVQIPHDLVTVIREPAARVHLHRSLGFDPGRRRQALSFQPGNLPAAGYGGAPPQITRNWLYRKAPA